MKREPQQGDTDMDMTKFEKLAQKAYARFGKLAKAYYYGFSRTTVTRNGAPCMLFLGNHSSGKSSLINWLVGGNAVQDIGLAPTDDGFTMLVYGETEEDICGPAVIARLPAEFADLGQFGGNLLQHLRIKVRNRPLLKSVTLIDSPGMIDSAEHTVNRSYDFEGVVSFLAKLCDMVFFLFDPDKPGTTGETVNVFAKCLGGMESKLHVLLNKCDAFASPYDFARTYGNVCWNLARVLQTKDLPKIWTIYSGEERSPSESRFCPADFNAHRVEFQNIVNDAAARRRDNVFSQSQHDFLGLSIRMRVVDCFARTLALHKATVALGGALLAAVSFFGTEMLLQKMFSLGPMSAKILGVAAALFVVLAAFVVFRLVVRNTRLAFAQRVDEVFESKYKGELVVGQHDDLRQIWSVIRDETAKVIREAPLGKLPFFGEFHRWRLDAAAKKVFATFQQNP
ncbi:MAG: 50S ribosome-binding GTPase [Kiritimatiellae bacterium]|nr:50S ribosome-binding GTPase [Kiritimatiellia bacterium]